MSVPDGIIYSVREVTFECYSCKERVTIKDSFIQWQYGRLYGQAGLHKHYCSQCQGLLIPIKDEIIGLVDWVYSASFNGYDEQVLDSFSSCPNANTCLLIDGYEPQCEHKAIDKKCLNFIRQYLDDIAGKQDLIIALLERLT